MPPPVYVAVAGVVVTIAAAIAFKEFVYAPHIAPRVDAWKEAVAERRRRERARRQGPISVPVMTQSALNERPPTSNTRAASPSPIELEIRRDATGWGSLGTDNNLRHRPVRTNNVPDEPTASVPHDPTPPTPLPKTSAASSPGPSGSAALPSPPIIHSPLPTTAINASRLQQSISAQSPEPSSSSITSPRSPSSSATQRSSSPAHSDLASSMSTASSFTPAVIGPASSPGYGTPSTASVTSDTVRSVTLDAQSPATSPFVDATRSPFSLQGNHSAPMSPFSDVNAVDARSPFSHPLAPNYPRSPSPVFLSPPQSSLNIASESDFAILSPSLRSGMLSPDMSVVDEDVFDIDDFSSSDGDSGSSDGGGSSTQRSDDWTSVDRRTPSPTNYTRHFE